MNFQEKYLAHASGDIYHKASGEVVARYSRKMERRWNYEKRQADYVYTGVMIMAPAHHGAYRNYSSFDEMVPQLKGE